MNNTLKNALRWIAVLPAAILAGICAYLTLFLWLLISETALVATIWEWISTGNFQLLFEYNEGLGLDMIILMIGCRGLSAAAFVYFGQNVAPAGKNIVAIVLATMRSLFGLITIASLVVNDGTWLQYLCDIGGIAGAIITAVYICKED